MSIYLNKDVLQEASKVRKIIFEYRKKFYQKYNIDILVNDTLTSTLIYDIVSCYDKTYNVNFARNGEDAISGDVIIEQKCSRVESEYTKKGKLRKNAGNDAAFVFHAHGDLCYPRYIFAAIDKESMNIKRLYDISKKTNVKIIQKYLLNQRKIWDKKCQLNAKHKKMDAIRLPEKEIKKFKLKKMIVNNSVVFKD